MTAKHATSMTSAAPPSAVADIFVLIAMALVAAAITVGLHLQMGLPLMGALVVGGALFAGLAGFQAMGRSVEAGQDLSSEVERLQAELDRFKIAPAVSPRPALNRGIIKPPVEKSVASQAPKALPPAALTVRAETPAGGVSHAVHSPEAPRPFPVDVDDVLFGDLMQGPAAPESPAPAAKPNPWTFRPAEPVLAPARPVRAAPTKIEAAPVPALAGPTLPVSPREDDVEMIQNLIKKMAAQVNAAELARETSAAVEVPADQEALQPIAAASLETSLQALRTTASTMRSAALPDRALDASEPAPRDSQPAAAATPVNAEAVALARAIDAGRVDVLLEPIVGLADKAARHYEVAIRVRSETADDLGTGDNAAELRGRGLLPLLDRARISRTAIIAERMADRGKTGSVFARTAGESLGDAAFTTSLQADYIDRPALARYMVLTFAQADVRAFTFADQEAVASLSQLGFRFAISSVTDLDMNFDAMARAGFGFVKLDADVFLNGLPVPGGLVPAADVCRHLAGSGFAVIVQKIEDEGKLARIAGCGAVLGQGPLFGGPRPVKADVVARPGQAAA